MLKRSKILALLSISCFASIVTCVVSSFAWFSTRNDIATFDNLGGSILQGYFHADGATGASPDSPFRITTAWHYENFVKLHYEADNFDTKGYYFAFGADDIPGTTEGVYKFYAQNTDGSVNTSASSDTLDLLGHTFTPIGTEEKPFVAHLNGNGLTVKNFKIDGKGMHDIGIFGYVNCEDAPENTTPAIHDCYWDDFEIITDDASIDKSVQHSGSDENHIHNTNAEIGYIAGHVVYASSLKDVYINNCSIKSTSGKTPRQIGDYGYYGRVEHDYLGGKSGKGNDYTYTLDSGEIYKYFDQNYDSISRNPVQTRNTEYSGKETAAFNADGTAVNPISNALNDGAIQYTLTGKTPANKNVDRNYSLSTLGYGEIDPSSETKYYAMTYDYDSGNNTFKYVPTTAQSSTESFETANAKHRTIKGDYYTNVGGSWEYYHLDNTYNDQKVKYTFKVNCVSNYYLQGSNAGENDIVFRGNNNHKLKFFVDGVEYQPTSTPTINVSKSNFVNYYKTSTLSLTKYNCQQIPISMDEVTYEIDLNYGKHYVACFLYIEAGTSAQGNSNTHVHQLVLGYGGGISGVDGGIEQSGSTVTATPAQAFEIKEFQTDNLSQTITLGSQTTSSGSYYWNGNRSKSNGTIYSDAAGYYQEHNGTSGGYKDTFKVNTNSQYLYDDSYIFHQNDSYKKTITFIDADSKGILQTDDKGKFKTSSISNKVTFSQITPLTEGNVEYEGEILFDENGQPIIDENTGLPKHDDPIVKHRDAELLCKYEPGVKIGETKYIADNEIITNSGYKYENIDVVGGGTSFYYYQPIFLPQYEFKVIQLSAEKENSYVINDPTSTISHQQGNDPETSESKLLSQTKFDATSYCPGSIVMFMKNTGNANDTVNSTLGNIHFTYINLGLGGNIGLNFISLTKPTFKKGNGVFVDIETMGKGKSNDSTIDLTTEVPCEITETGAQKSCYCAIDKYNNIICTFDVNGVPNFNNNNLTSEQKYQLLADIDRYVIVLGAGSNSTYIGNYSWITNVYFDYKAVNGYGGTFGNVGYRSVDSESKNTPGNKVSSTILNTYIDTKNENVKYSFSISYTSTTETINEGTTEQPINVTRYIYIVTFEASAECEFNVINYDPDNYVIYFKGKYKDSGGTVHDYTGTNDPLKIYTQLSSFDIQATLT